MIEGLGENPVQPIDTNRSAMRVEKLRPSRSVYITSPCSCRGRTSHIRKGAGSEGGGLLPRKTSHQFSSPNDAARFDKTKPHQRSWSAPTPTSSSTQNCIRHSSLRVFRSTLATNLAVSAKIGHKMSVRESLYTGYEYLEWLPSLLLAQSRSIIVT